MLIKDILTSFYKYSKEVFANINTIDKVYGITSGGDLTANITNSLGIDITECKGVMTDGSQFDISAQTLTFDTTADGIYRQDLVYIATDKTLKISKGTPSSMTAGSCTFTVNSVPVGDDGIITLKFPQYNSDGTQSASSSITHTYFRPGRDYTIGTTVVDTAANIVTAINNSADTLFSSIFGFTAFNGVITVTENYPSGLTPYDMFDCSFITAGTPVVSSMSTFNNIVYPSDLEFEIGICTVCSGSINVSGIKGDNNYIPEAIKGASPYYANEYKQIINKKAIKPNSLNKLGHSIKDFGAIGDGITDDTNAFTKALNYGGIIYIPDGTYIINPPIIGGDKCINVANTANVTLIGDRFKSILIVDGYLNFYTNYLKISGLTIQNKSAINLIGNNTFSNTIIETNYVQNNNIVIIEDSNISGYLNLNSFDYYINNILGINLSITINYCTKVDINNVCLHMSPSISFGFDVTGALEIHSFSRPGPNKTIPTININNLYTYYYLYGINLICYDYSNIVINNANLCNCSSTAIGASNCNIIINNSTGYAGSNGRATENFAEISNATCSINNCSDLAFEGMKIPTDSGYLPTSSIKIMSSKVIMNNCTWLYGVNNDGSIISGLNYDSNTNTMVSMIDNIKTAYLSTAPTSGTWAVGDTVYNTSTTAGSALGWRCSVAGTPGTWINFGQLSVSTSISTVPSYIGQIAIVSGIVYMSTGTSATTDWKQLSN